MKITDPIVLLFILPIAITFASSGIIRLIGGTNLGVRFATSAPIISLIICYVIVFGFPNWQFSDDSKILYIIIVSAITGIAVDVIIPKVSLLRRVLIIAGPLLALILINGTVVSELSSLLSLVKFVLTFIVMLIIGFVLADRDGDGNEVTIMIAMFAVGLAILALLGSESALYKVSVISAAAIAGLLPWTWPINRFPTNAGFLIGLGTPILAIGSSLTFTSSTNPIAIALLALIFFLDRFVSLPHGHGKAKVGIKSIALAGACAIIVLAAMGTAMLTGSKSIL